MKKLITAALLLTSQFAFAGSGTLTIGEWAQLPDCGGTVKITESHSGGSDQVNVSFRDVVNCSNFDILSANGEAIRYPNQKLGGQNRSRAGSFTLPKKLIDVGANSINVVVRSNTGTTSDRIRVQFLDLPLIQLPPPVEQVIVISGPKTGGGY